MQQLPTFPDRYWLKFSQEPVHVEPFDARSHEVAQAYLHTLERALKEFPLHALYHRGSTALKIAGKGDIEIGIIPQEDYWFELLVHLSKYYAGLGNLDEEYARFNDRLDGFELEIIVMRGYTALLDKKLHETLHADAALRTEYEAIKYQYACSQRAYNQQKDQFFRRVIERIPE